MNEINIKEVFGDDFADYTKALGDLIKKEQSVPVSKLIAVVVSTGISCGASSNKIAEELETLTLSLVVLEEMGIAHVSEQTRTVSAINMNLEMLN